MNGSIKKPNFFIIGAPKCGTTSLSRYLGEHPNVFFSDPKEPNYFDTDLSSVGRFNTKEDYLELFESADNYKAVGEGTVWYLYSKKAVPDILRFSPRAKFIVMVRNPIEMFPSLHSQLVMELNEDIKDVRRAWNLQEKRREGNHIPSTCKNPEVLQYGEICKLGKQIKRLYNNVPDRGRVKIIRFSNFKNNTKQVYESTLKFLNLESDDRKNFPVYNKNKELRSRKAKKIQIFLHERLGKISSKIKDIIGIKGWYFFKWNKKQTQRDSLDEDFRNKLENYFEEDQELLKEIINKNNVKEKIAIVHPDLYRLGGAESVCVNTLQALQDDYKVTLFTIDLTQNKQDWDFLNDFYQTKVNPEKIEVKKPPLNNFLQKIPRFGRWKIDYLKRFAVKKAEKFNLLFSTYDELDYSGKALQYIHFPRYVSEVDLAAQDERKMHETRATSYFSRIKERLHDKVYHALSDPKKEHIENNITLCNSYWTKEVIESIYDLEVQVIYPPVLEDFETHSWKDKEDGFVAVGRIARDKKVLSMVEMLSQLREKGYEFNFHIVGPKKENKYVEKVERIAGENNWIKLEGKVSRERLRKLMQNYKYGIHAREHEHFGIVVAEMLKAGMIPFVKKEGGQAEIVGYNNSLIYASKEEAVEKMEKVVSNTSKQKEILSELDASQFGQNTFQEQIKKIVNNHLEG